MSLSSINFIVVWCYINLLKSFIYFCHYEKDKNGGQFPHFIYFNKEPPGQHHVQSYGLNEKHFNIFDMTYTYRKDAIVPSVYGKFIPKNELVYNYHLLQDTSISNIDNITYVIFYFYFQSFF